MQTTVLYFRPASGYYAFRERGLVTGHSHARAFDSAAGACRIELFDLELLLPGACNRNTRDELLEALTATQLGLTSNRRFAPAKPPRHLAVIADIYINGDPLIGQTIRRLRDTPVDRSTSVAVLAKAAKLSGSQFSRRFTRALGLPLRAFLVYRRLRAAVEIQVATGTSLTEAAYTAGFTDLAHFSRQFAACFGVRPLLTYRAGSVQVCE